MKTTIKKVNEALAKEFKDLEIVRGNGYYYFAGMDAQKMYSSGLYGYGKLLTNYTPAEIVEIAKNKIFNYR